MHSHPHLSISESKSRAAVLSRQIQEEIARLHLPEGALFATEAQLCQTHAVSRTIVREAVGRLRTLGILRSVQKKGLVVGGGNPLGSFASALPFFGRSSEANLAQLTELRFALEVGAIELAVTNRTPEQIQRLRELAQKLARADEAGNIIEAYPLDLQFHSVILEMTGNPMVAGMARVLAEFFHTAYTAAPGVDRDPSTIAQHNAIAEAIADQNIELARVLIRQHVSSHLPSERDGNSEDKVDSSQR